MLKVGAGPHSEPPGPQGGLPCLKQGLWTPAPNSHLTLPPGAGEPAESPRNVCRWLLLSPPCPHQTPNPEMLKAACSNLLELSSVPRRGKVSAEGVRTTDLQKTPGQTLSTGAGLSNNRPTMCRAPQELTRTPPQRESRL